MSQRKGKRGPCKVRYEATMVSPYYQQVDGMGNLNGIKIKGTKKVNTCRMCLKDFTTYHDYRVCDQCKRTEAWQEGEGWIC
jgi:RecJ-like exonuclease